MIDHEKGNVTATMVTETITSTIEDTFTGIVQVGT